MRARKNHPNKRQNTAKNSVFRLNLQKQSRGHGAGEHKNARGELRATYGFVSAEYSEQFCS